MVSSLLGGRGRLDRRRFFRALGLAGAGAAGVAAAPVGVLVGRQATAAEAGASTHDHSAMTVDAAQQAIGADEMDAMHEAGVKAFPAATEGEGGLPLPFEMDGDVKVFKLTCQVVQWEYAPGKRVEAWTYNGVTPGPEIRVT